MLGVGGCQGPNLFSVILLRKFKTLEFSIVGVPVYLCIYMWQSIFQMSVKKELKRWNFKMDLLWLPVDKYIDLWK